MPSPSSNQASHKIITVEDPVEYRLPCISQVQVNPKIGAHVLPGTALHPAPGSGHPAGGEMRDNETVEIGLRGAITGHLVLTTLHTNDAVTSALRLIGHGGARLSGGERPAGRCPASGTAGVNTAPARRRLTRAGHLAIRALR